MLALCVTCASAHPMVHTAGPAHPSTLLHPARAEQPVEVTLAELRASQEALLSLAEAQAAEIKALKQVLSS